MIRALCVSLTCVLLICGLVVVADEPTTPAVEPAILPAAENQFSSEAAKADAEVAKAEAEAAKVKKAAAAVRLKAYKDRLVEVTKSGDFDKAVAVKARIDQLEKEPETTPAKAPKRARPKDVVKFAGHAYALIKDPLTWHAAKKRCEEMGGHLVCVNMVKEESFVQTLGGKAVCWVGASDEETEGQWINVDGSDTVFTNSAIDNAQGSEHYLAWDGANSGKFHDMNAGMRLPYICEWDR